jgi:lysine/ornithine N-monooxygenase
MAAAGHYTSHRGVVTDVRPGADGRSVVTTIAPTGAAPEGEENELEALAADLVIDATGLQADLGAHPLLADLLAHSGATRNPSGRLEVDRSFEVVGTRSGDGRLYATGAMTLGGPYAGVDSFLGLQYGALQIADDLAAAGFAPRLGVARSVQQRWRWARNRTPDGGRAAETGSGGSS